MPIPISRRSNSKFPVQRAYEITLQLVNKRKWLVIDERPPQPPRRIGRIEAVARTPIMGFREDVSIRVTPDGEDSRVDIRSVVTLFRERPRQQCRAHHQADRRPQQRRRQRQASSPPKKPVAPVKAPPKTGEEVTLVIPGRCRAIERGIRFRVWRSMRHPGMTFSRNQSIRSRRSPDRHRSRRCRAPTRSSRCASTE